MSHFSCFILTWAISYVSVWVRSHVSRWCILFPKKKQSCNCCKYQAQTYHAVTYFARYKWLQSIHHCCLYSREQACKLCKHSLNEASLWRKAWWNCTALIRISYFNCLQVQSYASQVADMPWEVSSNQSSRNQQSVEYIPLLEETLPLSPKALWDLIFSHEFQSTFHSRVRDTNCQIGKWQLEGN